MLNPKDKRIETIQYYKYLMHISNFILTIDIDIMYRYNVMKIQSKRHKHVLGHSTFNLKEQSESLDACFVPFSCKLGSSKPMSASATKIFSHHIVEVNLTDCNKHIF